MADILCTTKNELFRFTILNNHKEYSIHLIEYENTSTKQKWTTFDGFRVSNISREDIKVPASIKNEALAEFTKNVVFS